MKFFAGLNPWMLPVAAIASFMFGGVWYSLLSKPWMAAAKLDANKGGGQPVIPMIITFVAQMFMAWMLAGLLLHLTRAGLPATQRPASCSSPHRSRRSVPTCSGTSSSALRR